MGTALITGAISEGVEKKTQKRNIGCDITKERQSKY